MTTLMQCGHAANGTTPDGEPVCVIDAGTTRDTLARKVSTVADLSGRKSKCVCGRIENSDGSPNYLAALPFLRRNPDHDPDNGKYDEHYCGHAGWD